MITGAHVILYSTDADADRAFFRDVLEYPSVDAGHGWLIFALPPAELAVHPAAAAAHELYLVCDDLDAFRERMAGLGVPCGEPTTERWGTITALTLPGGGTLGVYQPTHPSPLASP
jgi:catechol 2,3-dioxygenase-like lactoylglutathione lyase family enzyme